MFPQMGRQFPCEILMKTRFAKTLPFAALLLGLTALPAVARDHGHYHGRYYGHGGYGRGYYHGPSVSFGFYSTPYYSPYYYAPPPVVYTRPVYATAARGSVEIDVQRSLAKRGYYGGVIDGDIGPQTRAAIRAYQVDRGLPVTARIDGNLLRSLKLL